MPKARTGRAAAQTELGADAQRFLDVYIREASKLGAVREIRTDMTGDGLCIWTMIDAEPMSFEPRKSVYEAELVASDASPEAQVDFRLVNRREYSRDDLEWAFPVSNQLVWQRTIPS